MVLRLPTNAHTNRNCLSSAVLLRVDEGRFLVIASLVCEVGHVEYGFNSVLMTSDNNFFFVDVVVSKS